MVLTQGCSNSMWELDRDTESQASSLLYCIRTQGCVLTRLVGVSCAHDSWGSTDLKPIDFSGGHIYCTEASVCSVLISSSCCTKFFSFIPHSWLTW